MVYLAPSEIFYDHLRVLLIIVADKLPYGVLHEPSAMAEVTVRDAKDAHHECNIVAAAAHTHDCKAGRSYDRRTTSYRPFQVTKALKLTHPRIMKELPMRPIRTAFIRIDQNVVRAILILTIPGTAAFMAYVNGVNALSYINALPIWAQILFAATIGAFLFTPFNNIGNLCWEIIALIVRRSLKAPNPAESPHTSRSKAFAKWEQDMGRASCWQVAKRTFKPCAKAALLVTALTALLPVVLTIAFSLTLEEHYQRVTWILVAITVLIAWFLAFLLIAWLPTILGLKLYLHK